MPTATAPNTPRAWNAEHAVLRRMLEMEHDWDKALPVLLEHHQAVHSAKLVRGLH